MTAEVLVVGIETSTRQTSVAIGTERETLGSLSLGGDSPGHELVAPAIHQMLAWTGSRMSGVGGVAVSLGPGLFTGMRVGIATAKTLAQALEVPIVGMASLDVLAFSTRHSRRLICAVIDAKRGEVFYAFYRTVPGGVARQTGFELGTPDHLLAELDARPEDILLVGTGALAYGHRLRESGSHVEAASGAFAYPSAAALVELAIPRLMREDYDRVHDISPLYMRRSDAEIAWDRRRRTG